MFECLRLDFQIPVLLYEALALESPLHSLSKQVVLLDIIDVTCPSPNVCRAPAPCKPDQVVETIEG